MNRPAALALALLTAGCASSSSGTLSPRTRDVVQNADMRGAGVTGSTVQTKRETHVATLALPAPPERVWAALAKVYADLGLPVTTLDTRTRLLGSVHQRVRRVGGKNPSEFFECGGAYGAASSYDFFITAHTQLVAAAGGTEARTEVGGTAKAPTSSTTLDCVTKGTLEQVIGERLQQQLAGG